MMELDDLSSWFVYSLDEIWHQIFSFIIGDPKQTPYKSLTLVNRRFYQLLRTNDDFSFFMLRAYILTDSVTLKPDTHFPSIAFLSSARGKELSKKYCTNILSHGKMASLISMNCHISIILHLLQYFGWKTNVMIQVVTNNETVIDIAHKCQELISLMSSHDSINTQKFQRIKQLLPQCLPYCTSASFNGETIADCCEHLIKYVSHHNSGRSGDYSGCPWSYGNEREMILAAAHNDGCILDYVTSEMKDDRDVVLKAVDNYGYALKYASDRLKNDQDLVMHAAQSYGYVLQYASQEIRAKKSIVSVAVHNNGYALEYASPALKDDFDVVMLAVRRNGCAIKYASKRLRSNIDIVRAATKNNKYASRYVCPLLRQRTHSDPCLDASPHYQRYGNSLYCT